MQNVIRKEDGMVYVCENFPKCTAYVRENPDTRKPYSAIADRKTRQKRQEAHYWFDQLYKSRQMSRGEAYARLADHMGKRRVKCHIGLFDEKECTVCIEFAKSLLESPCLLYSFEEHVANWKKNAKHRTDI